MKIGYVRVSTAEQNEQRQVEALKKFDMDKVFIDKASGKNADREQLNLMLDYVRDEDVVYVSDFSRLSRSVSDLLVIMEQLEKKQVGLVSLKEGFDISTPTGKLYTEWGFTTQKDAVEWFLSFGNKVKVLAPPEMVELMKSTLDSIKNLYES